MEPYEMTPEEVEDYLLHSYIEQDYYPEDISKGEKEEDDRWEEADRLYHELREDGAKWYK